MRSHGAATHPVMMNEKARSDTRRRPPADRAAHNGDHHEQKHQHDHHPAGIDLPLLGHVSYKSLGLWAGLGVAGAAGRSEEHTSELQSRVELVCRLLLEKKKK